MDKKHIEIAHRGYSSIDKDNTIISFVKAIEHDFDIIELDLQNMQRKRNNNIS
jgi:glycerophosphoryl diester phosphodiesterase